MATSKQVNADAPEAKRQRTMDDAVDNGEKMGRNRIIKETLFAQVFGSGTSADLEVRSHGDDEVGVYAARDYGPNEIIGGNNVRGLHWKLLLDPVEVIENHPLASEIRRLSAGKLDVSDDFLFWISLASMALKSEGEAREDPKSKNDDSALSLSRHDVYLQSLPRLSPEPCSWDVKSRTQWLEGTHLGVQVKKQYQLLKETYDGISKFATALREELPPFDINGEGKFGSLLWARGVHLSRSFPRQLLLAAKMKSTDGDENGFVLRTELGGTLPPRIAYHGSNADSLAKPSASETTSTTADPARIATNNMGVMLPFFDLCDHQSELNIVWEAGNGYVRFRFGPKSGGCSRGDPIYINYGPKGNQELLFTYGFALENPFDSVEGIVFGCKMVDGDRELNEARIQILKESAVPHHIEDGVLKIGPFSLCRKKKDESEEGTAETSTLSEHNVIPNELYHGLSVLGMDSVEEGPAVTPDEIDAMIQQFKSRIDKLKGKVEESSVATEPSMKEGFCRTYRKGEIKLLQLAIEELTSLLHE